MAKEDALYQEAVAEFGPALERLARGYEADPDKRHDLLQEIHVALWQSFKRFDNRCSLRTWVYRVAHNRALSYVRGIVRKDSKTVGLHTLEAMPGESSTDVDVDRNRAIERLLALVQQLPDLDRQVMMLHLEGLDAASIAEIAGLSTSNVGTKIHRLKKALIHGVRKGGNDA
jgi:RNA polymerase sigma-70 factor (ECF subfamily)